VETEDEKVDKVTEENRFFSLTEVREKVRLLVGYSFSNCSSAFLFLMTGKMRSCLILVFRGFCITLWVKGGTCH